jgi:hypothetical protein
VLADEFRDQGPFDDAYDVPYTTASVNRVTGGMAENIVADRCQVGFEFRTISSVDPQDVRARIQTYCDGLQIEMRRVDPRARVELRTRAAVPGLETDAASRAAHLGAALGAVLPVHRRRHRAPARVGVDERGGLVHGPLPALLGEMFPTTIRSTGMSVAYNIGVTVFGGFAPLILTWLARTGSLLAPSYYYVAVAVVSFAGLTVVRVRMGHR